MGNDREQDVRRCASCGKALEGEEYARKSFCSRRCREIDLMKWLNEEYRIREDVSDGIPEGGWDEEGR
ncbi:MAG: DNA gyrase inhibitor YacG [Leptospirales bacterium]